MGHAYTRGPLLRRTTGANEMTRDHSAQPTPQGARCERGSCVHGSVGASPFHGRAREGSMHERVREASRVHERIGTRTFHEQDVSYSPRPDHSAGEDL